MEREPEVLLLVLSSIQLLSIVLERENEFLRERNGLCFIKRWGWSVFIYTKGSACTFPLILYFLFFVFVKI